MTRPPPKAPWLLHQPYAHRGLWRPGGAPENSLAAFEAAARAGFGVELDVRLAGDGEAVVFHDDQLQRITGARGLLARRSAAELARLKLSGAEEGIPTLAAALDLLQDAPALIELKVGAGREGPLEARVANVLRKHRGPIALMSFNPAALAAAGRETGLACGRLFRGWRDPGAGPAGPAPDFLACAVEGLTHAGQAAARRRALPLLAWTVRKPRQLAHARGRADQLIFEHLGPSALAGAGFALKRPCHPHDAGQI